ncbi:D-alanyl-D-alanine carboxypeptidase/D-alanyl-D-alanine-endopeptidase [Thauera sp.]|uniref:D-alanyl-D-alanine carboxypeptidase/D-alanyl-D-alanine endopeptidase n=1 Tax=Thauera sp. TaxID=1905334 RepID=UPI002C36DA1E|nr:D-alanyl-D-alanine carboxypeptidase/D-alanyl-D-alanine-endopeptidase [Thauera sp.]HRP22532.1 D-alanyl-D-alanine carboxypeptidase/D-alanyl-D-alanine-endopeptidase [Thauera sp.]
MTIRLTFARISRSLMLAGALIASQHSGASEGLPPALQLALDTARIPTEAVSVWVQAVDAVQPTLALNADRPMNPASVMKLVTAFAALERLGPAHSWRTQVAASGMLQHGVLHGDLYLVGGADPVLGYDRMWKLLRRLRALGIERIEGDIVLDASALQLPPHDPDAFDGRGLRPYNSGPHGLLMHYNTLLLGLYPGKAANEPVTLAAEPPLAGVVIDNRILTSNAPCGTWYSDLQASIEGGRRLVLSGSLPAACGPRTWSAAPLPPAEFGIALVAGLWSEVGGRLSGAVREGRLPASGTEILFGDDSPPLADVVRDMNKWSSNVIARQLLATLGALSPARTQDTPHMVAGGARVAAEQLAAAGIDTQGLVIDNGSGLSRIERIRADSLGQLLLAVWRRPWMPEYLAALPVAGLDGTARRRLADSPATGQAHIKTGTLNGVRAIGGYLLDRHGRRHAVVMMVNHPEAHNSAAAQDALLEWVWAGAQ